MVTKNISNLGLVFYITSTQISWVFENVTLRYVDTKVVLSVPKSIPWFS